MFMGELKMSILPKLIYSFNAIPIKTPTRTFLFKHKLILKFMWKGSCPRITKTILTEDKVGGIALPDNLAHYTPTRADCPFPL